MYYFDEQLASYMVQFMMIFDHLQVKTGVREDGQIKTQNVPVTYGSRDRVTASILAEHTQNKAIKLPTMSAYMQGIDLAPELRKGIGTVRRETFLPRGGMIPDNISTLRQLQPVPYVVNMELGIYTSNMNQHRQILEQILMLFDPIIQIQKNDSVFDWTRITTVELTGISFDENYPSGTDKRMITSTLGFRMPVYISGPATMKTEYVKDVYARISTLDASQSFEDFLLELPGADDSEYTKIAGVDENDKTQIGEDCDD